MLLMLIIIEIICWSPWQSWIIFQFNYWNNYKDHPEDIPDVIDFFDKLVIYLSDFYFQFAVTWNQNVEPVLSVLRYYMVFLNSAINPLAYGYGNETMQKAFRITFPFLFKGQVSKINYKIHFDAYFILAQIQTTKRCQ